MKRKAKPCCICGSAEGVIKQRCYKKYYLPFPVWIPVWRMSCDFCDNRGDISIFLQKAIRKWNEQNDKKISLSPEEQEEMEKCIDLPKKEKEKYLDEITKDAINVRKI